MSPVGTFWDLMRSLPCGYCGAPAGERCRRRNGDPTSQLHAARYYAAKRQLRETDREERAR